MDFDAPQLRTIHAVINENGTACELALANADARSYAFRLQYRQLGYFMQSIRGMILEMRRRLAEHRLAAAAERIIGFAEAPIATSVIVIQEANTGDPTVLFETAEGTPIALRLTPSGSGSV